MFGACQTEELKNAMMSGQDAAIAKAIQELTVAYKKADEAVKAGASEDLEALKDALAKADQALQDSIDAVEKKLDDAIVNLTELINDGDKANSDAQIGRASCRERVCQYV